MQEVARIYTAGTKSATELSAYDVAGEFARTHWPQKRSVETIWRVEGEVLACEFRVVDGLGTYRTRFVEADRTPAHWTIARL